MSDSTIVVAGATGDLGGRIARALRARGGSVRALVRHGTAPDRTGPLQQLGVEIAAVDLDNASEVRGHARVRLASSRRYRDCGT